jgi:NAD+ synthase (glutamine-hydrolysing)
MKPVKIAVCQLEVRPASPHYNADRIIQYTRLAAMQGVKIVIFPELAVPGYLIGDKWEYNDFLHEINEADYRIIQATEDLDIAVIFGSVLTSWDEKGEDGRVLKFNSAFVARNGELVDYRVKTNQPNYRYFNDDKHFFSVRKLIERNVIDYPKLSYNELAESFIKPVELESDGQKLRIGLHLCEDMWDDDYDLKPIEILYNHGVDFFVNLSASPWGWQKNRKRHEVVRAHLAKYPAPYVYVNKIGVDQVRQGLVVYDGATTIYGEHGDILYSPSPYKEEMKIFNLFGNNAVVAEQDPPDDEQLFNAVLYAMRKTLPDNVVIGLSGGIDSALMSAMVTIAGKKVTAVNMPYDYNSQELKDDASLIARNLEIEYITIPIKAIAEPFLNINGVSKGSVTYENVLARARGNILCTLAQTLGAVITCNGNKVESAFNYATLYGDIIGAYAFLGDLTKSEVRQLATYVNSRVFKKEVIPWRVINRQPSAELKPGQFDPFDYGDAEIRGYHDELVRAFTEFRKTPLWVLQKLEEGKLEQELKLTPGRLATFFNDGNGNFSYRKFIDNLDWCWDKFQQPFKRNQSPYVLIVSRKALCGDYEESVFPMETSEEYLTLKARLLNAHR